jgi:hypothetical protein
MPNGDDDIWQIERMLWTGGEDHYRATLDPGCVMAFPAPAGIISGPQIIESVKGNPRWSAVTISEMHASRPSGDVVVLGYRAEATREGAAAYSAYCTSSYRTAGDRWLLIQHQQTPT